MATPVKGHQGALKFQAQVVPANAELPRHDLLLAADVGYSKSLAWRLGERCLDVDKVVTSVMPFWLQVPWKGVMEGDFSHPPMAKFKFEWVAEGCAQFDQDSRWYRCKWKDIAMWCNQDIWRTSPALRRMSAGWEGGVNTLLQLSCTYIYTTMINIYIYIYICTQRSLYT